MLRKQDGRAAATAVTVGVTLIQYTHPSCIANNYLGIHIVHISSFNMQNEVR